MSINGSPRRLGCSTLSLVLLALSGSAWSEGIANYRMDVRLDSVAKMVKGDALLSWNNRTEQALSDFCFHLYLNAFRNNRSTFFRERDLRAPWRQEPIPDDYWGYIEITGLEILSDDQERRITETSFIQPDDQNPWDRTVLRLAVDTPLGPGEGIQFRFNFVSKLPRGIARTGWVEDYFFVAQWFPKIGVFQDGSWNCHQYHATSEYFADFGVYDVSFTVPGNFVVGATGKQVSRRANEDGTVTYRYYQENIHDFAWTASPRFLRRTRLFSRTGLPEVTIILLLLPEHAHLEERYFAAAESALFYYGTWFGAYPYETLTIVDPAYQSETGGMEYPTFVTGRAYFMSPREVLSPEAVTVHEIGHQWWQGMTASNEFEEPWLDEGLTSWAESRALKHAYGADRYVMRFFGGIPIVFASVKIPLETIALPDLRRLGELDVMARPAWEYLSRSSYIVNSYRKPEMVLWTLERWLGAEQMLEVMRTYFQRFRFRHPSTRDFIATVNAVTGEDMNWFFDQTFFSSERVDYAVETAESRLIPDRKGIFDDNQSANGAENVESSSTKRYWTEVVVRRQGGARFPVRVKAVFEDGEEIERQWDGQSRWVRYTFEKSVPLRYAVVDPDRLLLLDVDPTNNSRYAERRSGYGLATLKWSSKWLFWLQNLLATFAFAG